VIRASIYTVNPGSFPGEVYAVIPPVSRIDISENYSEGSLYLGAFSEVAYIVTDEFD